VTDAIVLDELWIAVKCQTDSEIAGSPRNSCETSVRFSCPGVELLKGCSWFIRLHPTKLRIPDMRLRTVRTSGIILVLKRETAQTVS